jgi:hypothetical protein
MIGVHTHMLIHCVMSSPYLVYTTSEVHCFHVVRKFSTSQVVYLIELQAWFSNNEYFLKYFILLGKNYAGSLFI